MESTPNVSHQIANWLVSQGIEQVFMVTGGGAMFLNQALGRHPRLRCTFMHHEQACAIAAEGYARITGKPAVVSVTTGPGGINALNGVYGAWTDSIPMLVLSGQVKRETCLDFVPVPGLRQLGDQEGPVVHMAKPVCKLAEVARQPEDVARLLPEALSAATVGRPGPAWIDIPLDIQSATTPLEFIAMPDRPKCRPVSADFSQDCQIIAERLRTANCPLILAGTGVRCADAVDDLLRLAESTGIPIATAWTHDLIASDHPLFAGRPGTIGTRAGNFILQAADVVIVIGSRLNIRQISYQYAAFAKNAWLAQIDIDPAEFAKPFVRPQLAVAADAGDFLRAMSQAVENIRLPDYSAWSGWCRKLHARYPVVSPEIIRSQPLNPYVAIERITRQLRPTDIIACGNASACIIPFQTALLQAGQRMFSNSGAASMGYDLPAALGAALADPQRRVICFAGDGSLQMNIQELQTLKTTGANVIVIVIANRGYLSIRLTHENFFGAIVGATPESGVDFPDFTQIATAYGLPVLRVTEADDLPALDRALQNDGPLLIQLDVLPEQGFEPRIKSRLLPDGSYATPELDDMFPFLPPEELEAVRGEGMSIRSGAARP